MVGRSCEFINHRFGIVFDRDETVAVIVENHVIFSEALNTCALARAFGTHVTEISGR